MSVFSKIKNAKDAYNYYKQYIEGKEEDIQKFIDDLNCVGNFVSERTQKIKNYPFEFQKRLATEYEDFKKVKKSLINISKLLKFHFKK